MELGVIGLGRMGGGIARRLAKAGVDICGYDPDEGQRASVQVAGSKVYATITELVTSLSAPRKLWIMVPTGKRNSGQTVLVDEVIQELLPLCAKGDLIIEGGNSFFKDSQARAAEVRAAELRFMDVGVSGGVTGEANGYALMIGGEPGDVESMRDIFEKLAQPEAVPTGRQAWAHVGPAGAGHFVKMVHNAIEYGMMQAISEGFALLKDGPVENLDVAKVAKVWNTGTIIRSFLIELAGKALEKDPNLAELKAYVDDSGEGRWSVETAVEAAIPFWVNTAALYARFDSREPDSYALKLTAALRQEFGGHAVKKS